MRPSSSFNGKRDIADFDGDFIVAVPRMKMRRSMVVPEHRDYDPKKSAERRQPISPQNSKKRRRGRRRSTETLLLFLEICQRQRLLVLGPQQLLEGGGGGGFFLLHVDVALGRHAGACRDQPAACRPLARSPWRRKNPPPPPPSRSC